MIGRAISSKTSGGTGAGPGVNKYFFICGIFAYSKCAADSRYVRNQTLKKGAKKKAGTRACGSPVPDSSRRYRAPSSSLGITEPMGRVKVTPVECRSHWLRARVVMALRQ